MKYWILFNVAGGHDVWKGDRHALATDLECLGEGIDVTVWDTEGLALDLADAGEVDYPRYPESLAWALRHLAGLNARARIV